MNWQKDDSAEPVGAKHLRATPLSWPVNGAELYPSLQCDYGYIPGHAAVCGE